MPSTAQSRTSESRSWLPIPHRRTSQHLARRVRPALQLLGAWIAMHDRTCLFGAVAAHRTHHDCSIDRGFLVLVVPPV